MISWQRAAPRKCIGLHRLPRGEGDAGWRLATSIVDRVRELDRPTGLLGAT